MKKVQLFIKHLTRIIHQNKDWFEKHAKVKFEAYDNVKA
jgi:hypothetical protein